MQYCCSTTVCDVLCCTADKGYEDVRDSVSRKEKKKTVISPLQVFFCHFLKLSSLTVFA